MLSFGRLTDVGGRLQANTARLLLLLSTTKQFAANVLIRLLLLQLLLMWLDE